MEQVMPAAFGGNAQSKSFDSAGVSKMNNASGDRIKAANTDSSKDEEDSNNVVPFFQILDQQISRANNSSDDASNEKNTAKGQATLSGMVTLKDLQQPPANSSQSADTAGTGQTEISFDGLLKETDLKNVNGTMSAEKNADSADIQSQLEKSSVDAELRFKGQGIEKQSLLKTDEKTLQTEKTVSQEAQMSAGVAAKIAANLNEVKQENKSGGDILTAKPGKDDSTAGNSSRLTTPEMKESLVGKDNLRQYSNSTNTKAENKAQADIMQQAIIGETAGKIKAEQKEKIIAGGKGNEEISLTAVNVPGGGSANAEKVNNVSADDIIGQISGEIKETAANDGGRVKVTLNPPSLGKLELDVTVRNGKVEVVLVADNKDVQQTLNANIDRLKDSLQNQGLTIERCDVSMQDRKEEYQQNMSRQAFYQDGGSAHDGNNRQTNSDEEVNVGAGTIISEQPGSILRALTDTDNISLFA